MSDLSWSAYDFTKIPYDDIVRVGQRTMLYKDLFTVSWLLGRYCNYRCSYCWPYARSDTKDHRPTELCLKTVDEIKRQARERGFNSFHFSLSGGEPTFHPGYTDILSYLNDDVENTNYTSVHMTSNMSRPLKWFEEKYCPAVSKFHRASITASLHTEHVDTREKMQDFADKLILCQEHDVQITINMVMVPEWFERDFNNALFFHEQGINVTLKPQSDPTASRVVDGYTEEMINLMQEGFPQKANGEELYQIKLNDGTKDYYLDQAERFNAFGFNKFNGWSCNAGYQSVIIRGNEVKRAYSCHEAPLGTLEEFNLFKEPQRCITPNCVSSADSKIPKCKLT